MRCLNCICLPFSLIIQFNVNDTWLICPSRHFEMRSHICFHLLTNGCYFFFHLQKHWWGPGVWIVKSWRLKERLRIEIWSRSPASFYIIIDLYSLSIELRHWHRELSFIFYECKLIKRLKFKFLYVLNQWLETS